MQNEVSIVNAALSRIGYTGVVSSISPPDPSTEAQQAAIFYPIARDRALTGGSWSFNSKRIAPPRMEQAPLFGWSYAFAIPDDCLQIVGVYDSSFAGHDVFRFQSADPSNEPLPPQIFRNVRPLASDYYANELLENGQRVIYSNHPSIFIKYRARITNPTVFPLDFSDAVSWFLAGDLAGVLIKGEAGMRITRECMQTGYSLLNSANGRDALQEKPQIDDIPPSIKARF